MEQETEQIVLDVMPVADSSVETVDAPEIVEGLAEEAEVVSEEIPAVGTSDDSAESDTPEAESLETEEVVEEVTEEIIEPIVIEADAEISVVKERIAAINEKYELPEEVANAIAVLEAKVESNTIDAFADYGDADTVKKTLESFDNIYSVRQVDGGLRPNTDQFVQELVLTSPEKADWITHDLLSVPSRKYHGLTKLQEINADTLAVEGDTVGSIIKRQEEWQKAVMSGATVPESDIPSYIPLELHTAFRSLSPTRRQDLLGYVPDVTDTENYYAEEQADALADLAKIQKGLDAEVKAQTEAKAHEQAAHQELTTKQITMVETFIRETKTGFYNNLVKDVVFSDNEKIQKLQAGQIVTTIENAFLDDSSGEFAREVLKDSGIEFDFKKARELYDGVVTTSAAVVDAQRFVDAEGKPLNAVAVNKAVKAFGDKTREWREFSKDVIKQLQDIVKTGNEETVKEAVKKIKVQPKARPVSPKTAPSMNVAKDNTPAADDLDKWADLIIQDEARKARAYS